MKNDINLSLELLEKEKNLKEKSYKEEEAIIKNLLKETRVLDSKIKEICIKANLNLQDGRFVDDQRYEYSFSSPC